MIVSTCASLKTINDELARRGHTARLAKIAVRLAEPFPAAFQLLVCGPNFTMSPSLVQNHQLGPVAPSFMPTLVRIRWTRLDLAIGTSPACIPERGRTYMKTKLLSIVILAGGVMFAQEQHSTRRGFENENVAVQSNHYRMSNQSGS